MYTSVNLFEPENDRDDTKENEIYIIIPETEDPDLDKMAVLHVDRNGDLGKFARYTLPSLNSDITLYRMKKGYYLFKSVDELCDYYDKLTEYYLKLGELGEV